MTESTTQAPPLPPTLVVQHPWRILLTVAALALAADHLLYGVPPGIGMGLFFAAVWLGEYLNRERRSFGARDALLIALMAATCVQTAIRPSFSNGLVLLLLTIYGAGHLMHPELHPFWKRAVEGLLAMFRLRAAADRVYKSILFRPREVRVEALSRSVLHGRRIVQLVLPAVAIAVPFVVFLGAGNAILGDAIAGAFEALTDAIAGITLPSPLRIVFIGVVAALLFGLIGSRTRSRLLEKILAIRPSAPADPKDSAMRINQTRLALVTVNLLFFAANTTDVLFLWGEEDHVLPAGVTYSEYVHSGVHNLIACVLLASLVLLFLFRQSPVVTGARYQKALATAWIVQNLFLVSSVILRLKMYVDVYDLSVLRVNVVLFLALVSVGFLLLGVRIWRDRSFAWLTGANLLAVFALFFGAQFFDVRDFVARANYEAAIANGRDLDVNYLVELAPNSWPVLGDVVHEQLLPQGTIDSARVYLQQANAIEEPRWRDRDWRSWSYRRTFERQALALGGE